MAFAVLKPRYTRTAERVTHHAPDTARTWYEVDFEPVLVLDSDTTEAAFDEARRAGHTHPILGEVA